LLHSLQRIDFVLSIIDEENMCISSIHFMSFPFFCMHCGTLR
jgi:hypothetical protein